MKGQYYAQQEISKVNKKLEEKKEQVNNLKKLVAEKNKIISDLREENANLKAHIRLSQTQVTSL